ncbi:acetylserotonin O-methyltransferase [Haloarcula sp. S1CR25-12]|uniref:Acetylserotonin O-methyltransferase n=1 Tax=Haloarcula saliterrae TaxID=2950534 RepID=A0ABU2F778_9EURY|nr:methyltransferase [Haloarcula sp. S1CR25-12]MDS0258052.1 acetylserotonin O-methyltransferase [Haloarcula sp. S1CR25-12]
MSEPHSDGTSARNEAEQLKQAQELLDGLWSGQVLHAAVRVGLFDRLDEEPTAAETLAAALQLDPDATYRLLRALSHFGVLAEDDSRRFALTPVGQFFRADHPKSVQPGLMLFQSTEWVTALTHLPDILREGEPDGFVREYDRDIFDYMTDAPEFARAFNEFMTAMSYRQTDTLLGVLAEYDVSRFDRVCDVGGGHGYLLCRLLEQYPELEGTVFDRPSVVAEETEWPRKFGVTDRCTYVGGDMFQSVPEADAYVLKWILHDWSDEACVDVLSTVREAAPADARLFVLEAVVPGPEQSHFSKKLDVAMLAHMGGRERTRSEYAALLDRAGWTLADQWVPPEGPMQVLEARTALAE